MISQFGKKLCYGFIDLFESNKLKRDQLLIFRKESIENILSLSINSLIDYINIIYEFIEMHRRKFLNNEKTYL